MKKSIALLLCLVMIFTMFPIQAFATTEGGGTEPEPTETEEVSPSPSASPEVTDEPEETEEPEPSPTPTPSPEVTEEPDPTPTPSPEATEEPESTPTPSPELTEEPDLEILSDGSGDEAAYWESLDPNSVTISIPDYITVIIDSAFEGFTSLKTVVIPDSVTRIEEDAFDGCKALEAVYIPASVTEIAASSGLYSPFGSCSKAVVYCGASSKPSGWSYYWDNISSGVSDKLPSYFGISRAEFEFWMTVDRTASCITIPDGITTIPARAFEGQSGLEELYIPDSVKRIGSNAFSGCVGLSILYIPASVVTVEADSYMYSPFYDCSSTLKLYCGYESRPSGWDSDSTRYGYGKALSVFSGYSRDDYMFWAELDKSQTNVIIPDGIGKIPADAYKGNTGIKSLLIPASVHTISAGAFAGCTNLESVEFLGEDVSMGYGVFEGCTKLTSLKMPSNLTSLPGEAFRDCSALDYIYIPASVTEMGSEPFMGCKSSMRIYCGASEDNFSHGWNKYGSSASQSLKVLYGFTPGEYEIFSPIMPGTGSVVVPEGVTRIPSDFFAEWPDESITLPQSLKTIEKRAFWSSEISRLDIPEGVTSIGEEAFWLADIKDITLPSTLQTIGKKAFYWCWDLESIEIPGSVKVIETDTFNDCHNLKSLILNEGLEEVSYGAFEDVTGIPSLKVPKSIKSFSFPRCNTVISYPGTMRQWAEVSYCLAKCSDGSVVASGMTGDVSWFLSDKMTLTIFGEGEMHGSADKDNLPWADYQPYILKAVVEEGVTNLGECAFWGCVKLKSISLPGTLVWIDQYAFSWCRSLTSITIPRSVNTIGYQAFWDCYNLKTITFGHGKDDELIIADEAFILDTKSADTAVRVPLKGECNSAIKDYDWKGSKRKPSYKSSLCDGKHVQDVTPGLEPTCTEDGHSEYIICRLCKTEIKPVTVIPAKGHEKNPINTIEPTCLEGGYTEHSCSCGEVYKADFVSALGHDWDEGELIVTEEGKDAVFYSCRRCEEKKTIEHSLYVSGRPEALSSGMSINLTLTNSETGKKLSTKQVKWSMADEYKAYATLSSAGKLFAKDLRESVEIVLVAKPTYNADIRIEHRIRIIPAVSAMFINDENGSNVSGKTIYFNRNTTEEMSFAAQIVPDEANNKVSWSRSDKKKPIAQCTDMGGGVIKISDVKKNGSITLTAKASDASGKSNKVNVKIGYFATDIDITNAPAEIRGGAAVTLKTALVSFGPLSSKGVKWSLSEGSLPYASIDSKGKLFTRAVSEPTLIQVTASSAADSSVSVTKEILINPAVDSVRIFANGKALSNKQTVALDLVDGSLVLTTQNFPDNAPQTGYWSGGNKYATIDKATGEITALRAGTASFTWKAADGSGKSMTVNVKVSRHTASMSIILPANAAMTDDGAVTLRSGGKMTVKASLLAKDEAAPTSKSVKWASSDTSALTINSKGQIVAKTVYENKTVTVTATAADGSGVQAQQVFIVKPKLQNTLHLKVGGQEAIGKTVSYEFASNEKVELEALVYDSEAGSFIPAEGVKWASSKTSVAAFNADKELLMRGGGTATITAKWSGQTAKFNLKLIRFASQVNIVNKSGVTQVPSGKSLQLAGVAVTESGGKATNSGVRWTSSDTSVATVNSKGLVTAKKVYRQTAVTITATAQDGHGAMNSIELMVYPLATTVSILDSTGRTINYRTQTLDMDVSNTMELGFVVYPSTETGAIQKVKWSSSNTKIAKVDANGKVTAIKPGKVTITAAATDGSKKSVKITVNVVRLTKSLRVTNSSLNVKGGKSLSIKLAFEPYNTSSKAVTYSLRPEDMAFASVNSSGKITAKKVTSTKTVELTVKSKTNPEAVTTVTVTIVP